MKKSNRQYESPDGEFYPIRESTRSGMILMANQADLDKAQPGNAYECVLAQCAIRSGAKEAFIAGTIAYIVMPFRGEMTAVKFEVPPKTRLAIHEFDATGYMPIEGFELAPLRNSDTSVAKKVENAKRKTRKKAYTRPATGNRQEFRSYRYLSGHVHTREGA